MLVHVRSHLGLKPYKCEFRSCTKVFSQSQHLKRHQALHERLASGDHHHESPELTVPEDDHDHDHDPLGLDNIADNL